MKTYVVDTNIILDDVNNLSRLYDSENRIIIPETVIDELDAKKSLFDEVGYQARNFARLLSNLDVIKLNKFDDYTETILGDSTLKVTITSKKEYKHLNDPANILNDRKIIEVAKLYPDCIFITYDSMCKIRAISEGIKTETFGLKKDFDETPEFFKVLNVEELPENLSNILSIDPDYKHENYNYLIQSKDGNKKLARIQNHRINYIDEKHLEKQDVKPINIRQKYFVDAMLDTNVDLQVVSAVSGSGKSLLAIATGIRLVKEKQYSKIVYIRNSIESLDKGEDIGYLAGNDEKFAVFNHPLYDSLEYIVRKRLERSNDNKSKKTKIDNLKIQEGIKEIIELSGIETMWIGALRGRTISDAFVIVDECLHEDQKIITNKGIVTAKELEFLYIEDDIELLSYNKQTKKQEYKKLVSLKKEHINNTKEQMFKVYFENGDYAMLTGNHKLITTNGENITVYEMISRISKGETVEIVSKH